MPGVMPDEHMVTSARLRSTRTGRRPGNSGTREQIAAAARRQFAQRGYNETSIRSIAAEAGVDPGLIKHFYGTKQQMFTTVMAMPFDSSNLFEMVTAGDTDGIGERAIRGVLALLEDPDRVALFRGMVRSIMSGAEAADVLRLRIESDVLGALAGQLSADRPRLRTALAASQIVGFITAAHILEVEPFTALDPEQVVALLAPTLQRYLAEPL